MSPKQEIKHKENPNPEKRRLRRPGEGEGERRAWVRPLLNPLLASPSSSRKGGSFCHFLFVLMHTNKKRQSNSSPASHKYNFPSCYPPSFPPSVPPFLSLFSLFTNDDHGDRSFGGCYPWGQESHPQYAQSSSPNAPTHARHVAPRARGTLSCSRPSHAS